MSHRFSAANVTGLLRLSMLGACAILASCGLLSEPAVRLVTNHPEIAAYVEQFNARQGTYRVEIDYRETPSQSVMDGEAADVVIGEWLATPQLIDRFDSTADIVAPGRIEPSGFYAGLLSMGSKDSRPVLIPVSFDLPAIIFPKTDASADIPAMFMPLDLMQTKSLAFNSLGKNGSFASMGFSPSWNQDFLTLTARLDATRIRAGRGGQPVWEDDGLDLTVGFLSQWIAKVNGGKERDRVFAARNLVQPYYKLLATGKILFSLQHFTDFIGLPDDKRKELDFRWLSSNGLIPVNDDVLFAGLPRSSRNKKGAKAFLEWFFALQNQRNFLDVAQSRRIAVFGVSNGFSSFKSVNEKDIAQKYSILLGHIPSESMLVFPEILPDNWLKIRDEVLCKWLLQSAYGEETAPLSQKIEEWNAAATKK
jgi:hypothetical protein